MARKKAKKRVVRGGKSCHCPRGSVKISTRGVGRGFVCQGQTPKRVAAHTKVVGVRSKKAGTIRKRVKARTIQRPFVKAVCS